MDLFNYGLIKNPYYEEQSLDCEWVERRWWVYETDIKIAEKSAKKKYIVFEGLDYTCDIFVNGELKGSHENMFTVKKIDISDVEGETANLKVLFRAAPEELGQYGKSTDTYTQKSRFNYGWDFTTRLVNIGIWQDVYVEYINDVALEDARIYTDVEEGKGIVDIKLNLTGETSEKIKIELFAPDGKKVCEKEIDFVNNVNEIIEVENPELWYPNGMGEHPLYNLVISCDGEVWKYRVGIRKLRFENNPGSREDSFTYTFVINDQKMYLKGVNKVPFDHLYGNVPDDVYEWYVRAAVNQNVNIMRVWGGGIIEKEKLYDLCDENGILIWQDFVQSSSGVENVPSKKKDFLEKLKDAATEAIKLKRNHVSLTIWTGGNELTDYEDIPVKLTDENIAMLKEILDKEDPMRMFLPSTPSGLVYRCDFDNPKNEDVHGPWEYFSETHYVNHNRLRLNLHSEFGVSGPAQTSGLYLEKHEPGADKWNSSKFHGAYWWHSFNRDKANFGEFDNADEFVPYGQWSQAEALRYIIENERKNAPYTSGSMVWQINEPWPNCDCSCLIDYFGIPKMAYYWIKNAFAPTNVSLKYEAIKFEDELKFEVWNYGDLPISEEPVEVSLYNSKGKLLKTYNLDCKDLPYTVTHKFEEKNEIIMARVIHKGLTKDYFFSSDMEYAYRPARSFKKAKLSYKIGEIEKVDNLIMKATAKVKNKGKVPAYFVNPRDEKFNYAMIASDSFFTLLPGEEKEVELTFRVRTGLFFEKPTDKPNIIFDCLNNK